MQPVIDFVLEIDKLKRVTRKIRPSGLDRYENPAEHSWQIALLAASLVHFSDVEIDVHRVIAMLLVHDVGEIDTGDTSFFVQEGLQERKAAERATVERIFGLLPDGKGQWFLELWHEFEACETPESRFANAADRAMPVVLNLANDGQSWRESSVSAETVIRRVGPPIAAGCPALWEYLEARIEEERRKGWFGMESTTTP